MTTEPLPKNLSLSNILYSLDISLDESVLSDTSHLFNPIDIAIEKFKNHPSIITINNNVPSSSFEFNNIDSNNISKEITKLDQKKNGTYNNIPAKCF